LIGGEFPRSTRRIFNVENTRELKFFLPNPSNPSNLSNLYTPPCVTVNVRPSTTIVPLLAAPAFANTLNWTAPAPVPLLPDVIESQSTPGETAADQLQPASVVTVIVPLPPPTSKFCDSGAIATTQPDACAAVNVWPPATMVPLRAGPVFGAALKLTTPSSVPVEPPVTCSHASFETAVHEQPADVSMLNDPDPPVAASNSDEGLIAKVQVGVAPA
jgi:hypothetical protein